MFLVKQSIYKDVKVKCLFPDVISGQEQPHRGSKHLLQSEKLSVGSTAVPIFLMGKLKHREGKKKITFPKSLSPEPKGLRSRVFCGQ